MKPEIDMTDLVATDLEGYLDAGTEPDCVTELFDLHGKKVE